MTFAAKRALQQSVTTGTRVFEYGTGGSTAFFSRLGATVVGVEHDGEWVDRVSSRVGHLPNVEIRFVPPEVDSSTSEDGPLYRSTNPAYRESSFRKYASSIDDFDDGEFDIILIDGRARVGCFRHSHRKVRTGGLVVVDNSERVAYDAIKEAASSAGWTPRFLYGPGPYNDYFWETTIWSKTAELTTDAEAALLSG